MLPAYLKGHGRHAAWYASPRYLKRHARASCSTEHVPCEGNRRCLDGMRAVPSDSCRPPRDVGDSNTRIRLTQALGYVGTDVNLNRRQVTKHVTNQFEGLGGTSPSAIGRGRGGLVFVVMHTHNTHSHTHTTRVGTTRTGVNTMSSHGGPVVPANVDDSVAAPRAPAELGDGLRRRDVAWEHSGTSITRTRTRHTSAAAQHTQRHANTTATVIHTRPSGIGDQASGIGDQGCTIVYCPDVLRFLESSTITA